VHKMYNVRRELHRSSGVGFLSGVLGIAAAVLGWLPFFGAAIADLLGFLAIVCGVIAFVRPGSKNMAVLGIVLGIVMIGLKHLPILNFL